VVQIVLAQSGWTDVVLVTSTGPCGQADIQLDPATPFRWQDACELALHVLWQTNRGHKASHSCHAAARGEQHLCRLPCSADTCPFPRRRAEGVGVQARNLRSIVLPLGLGDMMRV
jgi:hypothetical protein